MYNTDNNKKNSLFDKFIYSVEKAGNKLPDPFFLFIYLCIGVLLLSALFNTLGISVEYELIKDGHVTIDTVAARNLLTADYIRSFLKNFVNNYVGFAPMGLIMIMMLSIGFAQNTGLFNAFMKRCLLGAPEIMVTFMLAVVGVCANIASNAGVVFATSIGAAIFASLKRNPILGAITGYVAVHGGFAANIIITGTDVLVSGITESASIGLNLNAPTHSMINYYFMIAATIVIAICTTFVTQKIMPNHIKFGNNCEISSITEEVTAYEKRGLRFAFISLVTVILIILLCTVPRDGFLRSADGFILPSSPFTDSIIALIFLTFMFTGIAYGIGAKTIKTQGDIPKFMADGLKGSLSFFVVALPASMFIKFFDDSKLAIIIATKGSELLQNMNLSGTTLIIAFLILTCFLNLFMTSGSSKWLILAPIFVPMFSVMNMSPALTQLIYRLGDSITNPIAPINYFLPVVIGIMSQYISEDEGTLGIGSLISMTLPYCIAFAIGLTALLVFWITFNLPLGPGASIFLN